MDPISVSPVKAAELTSLPVRAIYTALKQNLPSCKIGRRRIILVDDLQQWLRSAGSAQ